MLEIRENQLEEIIKKRRIKAMIVHGYIDLALRFLILILIAYLFLTQVLFVGQAKGMEMFPAVKDGDLIIGYRLQRRYEKNDLISYSVDGKRKIGRVVALAPDIVTIEEEGIVKVNGTAQYGEIMYPSYPKNQLSYPYEVQEDHIFVLGDYRTQSKDSRDYGAIPIKKIEGKVISILRRQGL